MSFATVRFEKVESVAVLTLARPQVLNAYNTAMRDDLYAILGAVRDDPEVRVVVLRGAGRAFSSGGDVREFGSAPSPLVARAVRWRRDVWGRLLGLRQATIAAVHGYALGAGFEMALLCDLCVAAEDACFGFPETRLGMIPGVGGTQTAPRSLGIGRALDLVLSGRWLDAREAHSLGIVNRVVPRARLRGEAMAIARRIAAIDPQRVAALKACVRRGLDLGLEQGLQLERRLAVALQAASGA